jgi:hypothetical protein
MRMSFISPSNIRGEQSRVQNPRVVTMIAMSGNDLLSRQISRQHENVQMRLRPDREIGISFSPARRAHIFRQRQKQKASQLELRRFRHENNLPKGMVQVDA